MLFPFTMSTGQVIFGASVSFTFTVKEQVAVFMLASVTFQTLVVVPTGKKEPLVSPLTNVTVAVEQLSDAAGVGYEVSAPHCPRSFDFTMLAGHVMVGACVSFTVTVKEQVRVLAERSVARQVLVVVPTG